MKSKFENRNFYEVLNVEKDASLETIKRSYRKMALHVHPDRNPELQATRDFQVLSRIMEILGDESKRKQYDQFGDMENQEDSFKDVEFMKTVYRKVTVEDIESFSKQYVGSEMERKDVIDAYDRFDGDMDKVLQYVPLSTNDSVSRFVKIVLNRHKLYLIKNVEEKPLLEAKETSTKAKDKKEKQLSSLNNLREKEKRRHLEMVLSLETKYKKREDPDFKEPTDEEWVLIQKKLDLGKRK